MNWNQGYYTDQAYTTGFYREMSPNWLDFASILQGHHSPRSSDGASFRYLDLGCGMAVSTCLFAALYPEGEFLGIDFHPDHILHAEWLAKTLRLDNIKFIEANFLNLRADPTPLGYELGGSGHFDYVVAHGIATWVTNEIQEALLSVAASALLPGGIFYCSYNTMPGWLAETSIHQLIGLQDAKYSANASTELLAETSRRIISILGTSENPTPLASALPLLKTSAEQLKTKDPHYLRHEYSNQGWCPLYVAEFHRRCKAHKLSFLSSALLPDNFPELVPPDLRNIIYGDPDPSVQATLFDLSSFRSFRRDLLTKGRMHHPATVKNEKVKDIRVIQQEADSIDEYTFPTSFGLISETKGVYKEAESILKTGPHTIGEWSKACGLSISSLLTMASMLLSAGRLGLYRERSDGQVTIRNQEINRTLRQLMIKGYPINSIIAPSIGNGIRFSQFESLLVEGLLTCQEPSKLARWVEKEMKHQGIEYYNSNHELFVDPKAKTESITTQTNHFLKQRLPWLHKLNLV